MMSPMTGIHFRPSLTSCHSVRSARDYTLTAALNPASLSLVKYMPEWLPGASFKKRALHYRSVLQEFRDKPFEVAVKAFVRPSLHP